MDECKPLHGGDGGEEEGGSSAVVLGADVEVLRRLACRVSAARRVLASDDIGGRGLHSSNSLLSLSRS